MSIPDMTSNKVLSLYNWAESNGITVWIDGGWCVNALLGIQTRKHDDLDIAISRKDNIIFRRLLEKSGYSEEKRNDSSAINYVLKNEEGYVVDVHVFEHDDKGKIIYGIPYPFESLTGKGSINGQIVNCINPEYMFKFKLWAQDVPCKPRQKDVVDAQLLSQKFGFELPPQYK